MPKLSPIWARKLIGILEKLGFEQIHQKGSHVRLKHQDGRRTTIPLHAGEKVGVGLLRKILRDVNITEMSLKNSNKKLAFASSTIR